MLQFPNAKINLGLHVISRRPDGFHNIQTIFYPIKINDALEIIENPTFLFTSSGLPIAGNTESNLCVKAYHLLKTKYNLPPVHIHLHKHIPMGAGLGGGSADASVTLKLLNEKFDLKISNDELQNMAAQLGSDCPFFIINKPMHATGRGEVLSPIEIDLANFKMVVVYPAVHVNTGWAYGQLTPAIPSKSLKDIIQLPIAEWKENLKNDFEKPVFELYPEIAKIKQQLYQQGALYASMSGSGSAVFGIFEKEKEIDSTLFTVLNYQCF